VKAGWQAVGVLRLLLLALVGTLLLMSSKAMAALEFECGGRVEAETWALWDGKARGVLGRALIEDGLVAKGDTYTLYDIQNYLHNLVAMAARCGRTRELASIAQFLTPVFDRQSEVPGAGGQGWVCRGGRACSAANRLIGTEVILYSSQYLAMVMRVASALVVSAEPGSVERAFVERASRVAVAHLDRWTGGADGMRIAERLAASTPGAVRDKASRLFFNDTDLWVLAIAAELSGVVRVRPELLPLLESDSPRAKRRRSVMAELVRLFVARVSLHEVESNWIGGHAKAADLDRGYWRRYPDHRFAGYRGEQPPVGCNATEDRGGAAAEQSTTEAIVDTIGWDFSHARRLVHALDALERQRAAFVAAFAIQESGLPAPGLPRQFAAQLVASVWNGDLDRPLFANFWDASNGWYRAGYGRGAAGCFPGYPPSGLSDAFPTGGFASWAQHYPVLGTLAERLYAMARQPGEADTEFLRRYYAGLAPGAPSSTRVLTQLMFWPSLVRAGATPKS
jgi:hypothetical protein